MEIKAVNPKHQRALEELYEADVRFAILEGMQNYLVDRMEWGSDRQRQTRERFDQISRERYWELVDRYIKTPKLPKYELRPYCEAYVRRHNHTSKLAGLFT